DRSSARGGGRGRRHLLRACDPRRHRTADDKPRSPRPGLRPRLRAEHGPPHADRGRHVQFLRLWRHERDRRLPAFPGLSGTAAAMTAPGSRRRLDLSPAALRQLVAIRPGYFPVLFDSAASASGATGHALTMLAAAPMGLLALTRE